VKRLGKWLGFGNPFAVPLFLVMSILVAVIGSFIWANTGGR
jgi:hypothetical protein